MRLLCGRQLAQEHIPRNCKAASHANCVLARQQPAHTASPSPTRNAACRGLRWASSGRFLVAWLKVRSKKEDRPAGRLDRDFTERGAVQLRAESGSAAEALRFFVAGVERLGSPPLTSFCLE